MHLWKIKGSQSAFDSLMQTLLYQASLLHHSKTVDKSAVYGPVKKQKISSKFYLKIFFV